MNSQMTQRHRMHALAVFTGSLKKRAISIYPLSKVRSASQTPVLNVARYRRLSPDISISFGSSTEIPDISFDSVMLVKWAFRILTNG